MSKITHGRRNPVWHRMLYHMATVGRRQTVKVFASNLKSWWLGVVTDFNDDFTAGSYESFDGVVV